MSCSWWQHALLEQLDVPIFIARNFPLRERRAYAKHGRPSFNKNPLCKKLAICIKFTSFVQPDSICMHFRDFLTGLEFKSFTGVCDKLTSFAGGGLYSSVCHLPNSSIFTEFGSWTGWFLKKKYQNKINKQTNKANWQNITSRGP